MATISRSNNGASQNTSRRAYITTTAFQNHFFSYRTYLDADRITQGELDLVTASPSEAPKNRILRETGKKLFPNGVNPGVDTLLVGVYDSVTFLNGYIDPNSPVFAVYSTDLANFLENGEDPATGGRSDRGPPVITNGLVEALSSITTTGGDLNAPAGSVTVLKNITGAHLNITPVSINTSLAGSNTAGSAFLSAGAITVSTISVSTNSLILLSHKTKGTAPGVLYLDEQVAGVRFHISSSSTTDDSEVSWLLIN